MSSRPVISWVELLSNTFLCCCYESFGCVRKYAAAIPSKIQPVQKTPVVCLYNVQMLGYSRFVNGLTFSSSIDSSRIPRHLYIVSQHTTAKWDQFLYLSTDGQIIIFLFMCLSIIIQVITLIFLAPVFYTTV
jgi:hypothetical protein